eukprot:COSAG02_NODE_7067_length_3200_cov_6.962593_1_plen_145_part_10
MVATRCRFKTVSCGGRKRSNNAMQCDLRLYFMLKKNNQYIRASPHALRAIRRILPATAQKRLLHAIAPYPNTHALFQQFSNSAIAWPNGVQFPVDFGNLGVIEIPILCELRLPFVGCCCCLLLLGMKLLHVTITAGQRSSPDDCS